MLLIKGLRIKYTRGSWVEPDHIMSVITLADSLVVVLHTNINKSLFNCSTYYWFQPFSWYLLGSKSKHTSASCLLKNLIALKFPNMQHPQCTHVPWFVHSTKAWVNISSCFSWISFSEEIYHKSDYICIKYQWPIKCCMTWLEFFVLRVPAELNL